MKGSEIIKRNTLFSGIGSAALAELARIAGKKSLSQGEILFSEGEDATSFFIMIEGELDLVKLSPGGREQLVRKVTDGEVFAEAAMFSGISYPVTAIARAKSEILSIDKSSFLSFIKRHPDVSLKMMGVMSDLLRHMNSLLAELSLETVSSRLASYLLKRMRQEGKKEFILGISKKELAFRIGTIPETLSRNLKKMTAGGIIEVAGKCIKVRDVNQLELMTGR